MMLASQEGIVVTIVGMGVVFAFLVTLIISMIIMSKIVIFLNKLFPVAVAETAVKTKKINKTDDSAIAVAIAAIKRKF
ncbi:MAG: hypothetical protein E7Z91_03380 [Cyanobacteria bacterium SIG30]|nr:hypothetical protein [Cyanobacteria bacterium SIG30]